MPAIASLTGLREAAVGAARDEDATARTPRGAQQIRADEQAHGLADSGTARVQLASQLRFGADTIAGRQRARGDRLLQQL